MRKECGPGGEKEFVEREGNQMGSVSKTKNRRDTNEYSVTIHVTDSKDKIRKESTHVNIRSQQQTTISDNKIQRKDFQRQTVRILALVRMILVTCQSLSG